MAVMLLSGSLGGFGIENFPSDLIQPAADIWKQLPRHGQRDASYNSVYHSPKRGQPATISSDVAVAACLLADSSVFNTWRPFSGVVRKTNTCYACEYHHLDGTVSFSMYDIGSGQIMAVKVAGDVSAIGPATVKMPYPAISARQKANLLPLILPVLAAMRNAVPSVEQDIDTVANFMHHDPESIECVTALYRLSDAFYYAFEEKALPLNLATDGVIGKPADDQLFSGNYDVNEVITGFPKLLLETNQGNVRVTKRQKKGTIGELKNNPDVQAYILAQGKWTDEEREWIPQFSDSTVVPPEVTELVMAHVKGQKCKRPIVNMAWRGTSGHGKSTGVEMMACILDKPLLRLTCYSTMETEKFLTAIMPDTSGSGSAQSVSFEEIACDPEGTYEKLTGKYVPGISCDEVFAEAVKAVAANVSTTPRYVMQESTYVQALVNGYICEVQESSRIRDAGVLPGLNEYDRPGAMIPMVDGSWRKRDPFALVIFTDNVGYNSCNELDPSVIRRIAYIIDSIDIGKKEMVDRIIGNTGVTDRKMVEAMYDVWHKIQQYCQDNDLLSAGGCVTIEELERWVQLTDLCGIETITQMCKRCVVSKASSDFDEQKNIITAVMNPALTRMGQTLGITVTV